MHKVRIAIASGHLIMVRPDTPPEISLRRIRSFLAVAEHGSIRRAATELDIQNSTVSRQIRIMEERVGVSLFERHGSGVRPTIAGQRLVERLRRAMAGLDLAFTEARSAGTADGGDIAIAYYPSLASGNLRQLLAAHAQKWPRIRADYTEAPPVEQLAGLRGREFDAAFLIGVEAMQDFDSVPLWAERVHVALPEDHILAKSDVLTWQHIRYEPFVVRRWSSGSMIWHWLADRMIADGIEPNIAQHAVSRGDLLGLVAIGRGITVISDAATGMTIPGVVYRPVDDPGATITVRLAWMPENDNPALRRFVSFAKSFVQDSGAVVSSPS